MKFEDLGLDAPLLDAVKSAGYSIPTSIQQRAIGPALEGRDLFGCAQTGTGKTAAFALPVLQRVDRMAADPPRIRALILAPTRELAMQIGESFSCYGKHLELWHTVIFGGVNEKSQIAELKRGVDILIATPGRLLDLMNRGHVALGAVEIFVLDEADRMLDMGFIHDVRRVTRALPKKRQTLMFSATVPPTIESLAAQLLSNPVRVQGARVSAPADGICQGVYMTEKRDKPALLVEVLRQPECQRVIVFSRTKHGANRLAKLLEQRGLGASAIHGNKSQSARTRALEGFRNGSTPVLVATDIAARGVDVAGISHVINFDLPNEPETYVHRIGRTARAGSNGIAWSFCGTDEAPQLAAIERLLGQRLQRLKTEAEPSPGVRKNRPPPARASNKQRENRYQRV